MWITHGQQRKYLVRKELHNHSNPSFPTTYCLRRLQGIRNLQRHSHCRVFPAYSMPDTMQGIPGMKEFEVNVYITVELKGLRSEFGYYACTLEYMKKDGQAAMMTFLYRDLPRSLWNLAQYKIPEWELALHELISLFTVWKLESGVGFIYIFF